MKQILLESSENFWRIVRNIFSKFFKYYNFLENLGNLRANFGEILEMA